MAKIMLVEDDNSLREIYQARLMAEGYETVTAKDGEEALVLIGQEKPDLIILDIMMPKISGFDTLDILRSTPATKYTKVIIMSALSQAEDKARAEKLGANKYLVKSQVTLEDIVKTVKEVLGSDDNSGPKDLDTSKLDPAAPASTDSSAPAADDDATDDADDKKPDVAEAEAKVAAEAQPAAEEQSNVVNEEKESMNNDTPTPSEPAAPSEPTIPTDTPSDPAATGSPIEVTSDPSPLSPTPTVADSAPSSSDPISPAEPEAPISEAPAAAPSDDSTQPVPDAGQVVEPSADADPAADTTPTGGGEVVEPAAPEAPVPQDSEAPSEKSHLQDLIDKENGGDSPQAPSIS